MRMAKMMGKGPTCSCGPGNFLWMVIAAVVLAVGVYVFVMALQAQWSGSATFVNVALWYALGVLIITFGKMAKWKSCSGCSAHQMS